MPTDLPLGVTAVMLPELDFDEQIALCQRLGVTHYSVRPRVMRPENVGKPYSNWGNHKFDLDPTRLLKEAPQIKKKLADAGLTPFGTVPQVICDADEDELKMQFEGCAAVGAGRMRVATLSYPEKVFDYQAELDKNVAQYQRVVAVAKQFNVKVVIETHSRSLATSPALALNICKHFDPADLGVIFDFANFCIEGNLVPRLAVSVLNKYIDHVHVGGSFPVATGHDENGFRKYDRLQSAIDDTVLYLPDWLDALRDAELGCVPLVIEDFSPTIPGALRLERSALAIQRLL